MACLDDVYAQAMNAHNKESHHNHKVSVHNKIIARRGMETLHGTPASEESVDCVPGKMYEKSCQTCFCNDKKTLNCTGSCDGKISLKKSSHKFKTFPFKPEDIPHFPILKHLSEKCEPGKMYRIACNGCLCRESHNLICENKLCLSYEEMAKHEAKRLSGNKCTKDEKYGCVQCDCENKVSKCKVIPKCDERERLSGHASKVVPLSLNVHKEKCLPGMKYTVQCNRCVCQQDFTLRCTQKACLNYSQVLKLEKQRLHLVQQGL